MLLRDRAHTVALAEAVLVTVLWSSSWVLIKLGLAHIPALPFAGLRYGLAALCLLPCVFGRRGRVALAGLDRSGWLRLAGLGVVMITLTQGAQFAALALLPAATVSLFLACTPVVVVALAALTLGERLVRAQAAGVGLFVVGATVYLGPPAGLAGSLGGLAVAGLGLAANAGAAVLGRAVNRRGDLPPFVVTGVSMAIGAPILLAGGAAVQGLPRLDATGWAIVLWLAVVNTALAFTMWNHSLRRLEAVESSVVNNTMLVQVAILAWVFLGEALGPREIAGLVLAAAGALVVQLGGPRPRAPSPVGATPSDAAARPRASRASRDHAR